MSQALQSVAAPPLTPQDIAGRVVEPLLRMDPIILNEWQLQITTDMGKLTAAGSGGLDIVAPRRSLSSFAVLVGAVWVALTNGDDFQVYVVCSSTRVVREREALANQLGAGARLHKNLWFVCSAAEIREKVNLLIFDEHKAMDDKTREGFIPLLARKDICIVAARRKTCIFGSQTDVVDRGFVNVDTTVVRLEFKGVNVHQLRNRLRVYGEYGFPGTEGARLIRDQQHYKEELQKQMDEIVEPVHLRIPDK